MAAETDPKNEKWLPTPLDTYEEWQATQGIPVISGFFIPDINTAELSYWDLKGGPAAHVVILSGQGYSDLGLEGEEVQRVEWKAGSVVVPPDQWIHQHFNSGATPARYLALRWNNWRYRFMKPQSRAHETFISIKDGGSQIEFEDEDPAIHRDFEAAMKKAGAKCAMGGLPSLLHRKRDRQGGIGRSRPRR